MYPDSDLDALKGCSEDNGCWESMKQVNPDAASIPAILVIPFPARTPDHLQSTPAHYPHRGSPFPLRQQTQSPLLYHPNHVHNALYFNAISM